MNEPRFVETTGSDVETAIQKGLAKLGASKQDVIVEILEEPTRGLFGIGGSKARVRLTLFKPPTPPKPEKPPAPKAPAQAETGNDNQKPSQENQQRAQNQQQTDSDSDSKRKRGKRGGKGRSKSSGGSRDNQRSNRNDNRQRGRSYSRNRYDDRAAEAIQYDGKFDPVDGDYVMQEATEDTEAIAAKETLQEILAHMNIEAEVTAYHGDERFVDDDEEAPFNLQITGQDLGILIGRGGDTLASLQYLTRLIASRDLQRRCNVVVDVEGYKQRRARQLRSLALRMAEQATELGKTVQLEPMAAYERRIIHMTLRESTSVYTRSIGEGDSRKVTIIPVKNE